MGWKQKIPCIFKAIVVLVSSLLLIYWSLAAIDKFKKQPIATYITYTLGDDNEQLMPPHVTVCRQNFVSQDKILSKCSKNSTSFSQALLNCLNDTDFDPTEYLQYLINKKVKDEIITFVSTIWTAPFGISLEVQAIFSMTYGLCASFDPKQFNHWHFRYTTSVSLTLNQSSQYLVMLHTDHDYLDSCSIHYCFKDVFNTSKTWLGIKKKLIYRESTQILPCGEFSQRTCLDIQRNEEVAKRFNCKLPLLYSGKHLDRYVSGYSNLPQCQNKSTLLQALTFKASASVCQADVIACNRVKFSIVDTKKEHLNQEKLTVFGIRFEDIEVEHFISYISYDLQSLISELGGVLGMFLGLSGLSLGFTTVDFLGQVILSHYC
jgi:hypothetical protein